MMKKLFLIILLASLSMTLQVASVAACSGYAYFGVENLPEMELLVRATVIDTDDRGYNAIIRVEDYYKGEGEQFITVMRYPAGLSSGAMVRGYDTGCLYSGRGHRFVQGTQGYFGLRSNGNGTYSDAYGGTAHFYAVDGMITYQEGATEGYAVEMDEPLTITEEDFIATMLEVGGREAPIPPTVDTIAFYPLMRFLSVTTENGTRYQVNPDRSVLQLPDDAPLAISPDGAHVAFRADDETIGFRYIWTDLPDETYNEEFEALVAGEAVRFSNDSNFVTVWNHNQLSIYMFDNLTDVDYGQLLSLNQVAQVELASDGDQPLTRVLWSADSSTIAWEDDNGVWRWNIVEDAAPELLMSREDVALFYDHFPTLLDISVHGRYIRIGYEYAWTLIDGETLQTYDYVIASPDEHTLIYFGNIPREISESPDFCTPPLRETCAAAISDPSVDSIFDYELNLMGFISCEDALCFVGAESWQPSIGETGYSTGRRLDVSMLNVRYITYDQQYSQPAILIGEYDVYFGFYWDDVVNDEQYAPYLDIVYLENIVDSPITSIEWGQPIFYDAYNLTTTEYLP